MGEVEAPAEGLAAAVFTHDAVEPAFEPAGQIEIGAVDGENERVIENGAIEPVRQDQLDADRATVAIGSLLPLVDPREAMPTAFRRLADRGRDGGGLEPVERGLQALVIAQRYTAADEGENS